MRLPNIVKVVIIAAAIAIPTITNAAGVTLSNVTTTAAGMKTVSGWQANASGTTININKTACTPKSGQANIEWDTILWWYGDTGTMSQGSCSWSIVKA